MSEYKNREGIYTRRNMFQIEHQKDSSYKGRSLNQIYGVGLGNEHGIFAWPFAACAGKVVNGKFTSISQKEAEEIARDYVYLRKNINKDTIEEYEPEPPSCPLAPIVVTCALTSIILIAVLSSK